MLAYGNLICVALYLDIDVSRRGYPVRYYRNGDSQIEFVVETEDGVVPVEVKSSTSRTLSLDRLLECGDVPYGIKLTGGKSRGLIWTAD